VWGPVLGRHVITLGADVAADELTGRRLDPGQSLLSAGAAPVERAKDQNVAQDVTLTASEKATSTARRSQGSTGSRPTSTESRAGRRSRFDDLRFCRR